MVDAAHGDFLADPFLPLALLARTARLLTGLHGQEAARRSGIRSDVLSLFEHGRRVLPAPKLGALVGVLAEAARRDGDGGGGAR